MVHIDRPGPAHTPDPATPVPALDDEALVDKLGALGFGRYDAQLVDLKAMGFEDEAAAVAALEIVDGDIERAVEVLVGI